MKFFVHEPKKGEAEIYDNAAAWSAAEEQSKVPEWFKKTMIFLFDHGQIDKYHSLIYGEFYIIDIPPFYWSGALVQDH